MKIKKVEHVARRDGKPITTYKLRYKETVRNPATGQPERYPDDHANPLLAGAIRTRSRSETYPTFEAAKARRLEIENQRDLHAGRVIGREVHEQPFGTFATGWLQSMEIRVQRGRLKRRTLDEYARVLRW